MPSTQPSYPRRRPDLMVERFGRETLIMHTASDRVHFLNPTAQVVWELCDGHHTAAEMAAALREQFAAPSEQDVAADVAAVLADFAAHDLLV